MDQSAPSKDAKRHTNAMPGWLMVQSQPPGELVADGIFVGQIATMYRYARMPS
jgi:hypothetical protein